MKTFQRDHGISKAVGYLIIHKMQNICPFGALLKRTCLQFWGYQIKPWLKERIGFKGCLFFGARGTEIYFPLLGLVEGTTW